jgi:hypothetical protein
MSLQQVRKLILEMIPRLPTNDLLRPYVKPILTLMLKLLQIDNEENVQVCVRIIIELHKQYRPTFNPEVQNVCFHYCLISFTVLHSTGSSWLTGGLRFWCPVQMA